MNMTIAAVIPLYNGAEFIDEALRSVFRQTEPADEIIVVDDGSTDDGPSIVESLAARHPITLLRQPNAGQSSARNMAVKHAHCSHIAFLDQDDVWYEEHLATLKKPFVEAQVRDLALVYGNLDVVDRHGRMVTYSCLDEVNSKHPKTSLRQCLEKDLFILPSASLVVKDAILKVGLFDERLSGYEDDDLFVRIFWAGYRSVYLNIPVTRWRIYGNSSSFSARMAKSRMIYFKKQMETFPDDPALNMWSQNIISPRFMRLAFAEFVQASRDQDIPTLERAWSDVKEIARTMNRRTRQRTKFLCPVIERLSRGPLTGVARALARYAIRL